jgi:hypothetical protein
MRAFWRGRELQSPYGLLPVHFPARRRIESRATEEESSREINTNELVKIIDAN